MAERRPKVRNYADGKKVGEWKVYDKAGELKQSRIFKVKSQ